MNDVQDERRPVNVHTSLLADLPPTHPLADHSVDPSLRPKTVEEWQAGARRIIDPLPLPPRKVHPPPLMPLAESSTSSEATGRSSGSTAGTRPLPRPRTMDDPRPGNNVSQPPNRSAPGAPHYTPNDVRILPSTLEDTSSRYRMTSLWGVGHRGVLTGARAYKSRTSLNDDHLAAQALLDSRDPAISVDPASPSGSRPSQDSRETSGHRSNRQSLPPPPPQFEQTETRVVTAQREMLIRGEPIHLDESTESIAVSRSSQKVAEIDDDRHTSNEECQSNGETSDHLARHFFQALDAFPFPSSAADHEAATGVAISLASDSDSNSAYDACTESISTQSLGDHNNLPRSLSSVRPGGHLRLHAPSPAATSLSHTTPSTDRFFSTSPVKGSRALFVSDENEIRRSKRHRAKSEGDQSDDTVKRKCPRRVGPRRREQNMDAQRRYRGRKKMREEEVNSSLLNSSLLASPRLTT